MSTYNKEFAPKIESSGIMEISLLIEHSSRTKSVYFEIYNDLGDWMLYWNFEPPLSIIKQELKKGFKTGLTVIDVLDDEEIKQNIRESCKIYECKLNEEDIFILEDLLDKKIPKVEGIPLGLDGSFYTVKINGNDYEYRFGCFIPSEWIVLIKLIEMIVKKAELSDEYLVNGFE